MGGLTCRGALEEQQKRPRSRREIGASLFRFPGRSVATAQLGREGLMGCYASGLEA